MLLPLSQNTSPSWSLVIYWTHFLKIETFFFISDTGKNLGQICLNHIFILHLVLIRKAQCFLERDSPEKVNSDARSNRAVLLYFHVSTNRFWFSREPSRQSSFVYLSMSLLGSLEPPQILSDSYNSSSCLGFFRFNKAYSSLLSLDYWIERMKGDLKYWAL